jgi:hypothetical protein
MVEGFSLGSYLLLVEYTGRLLWDGKAVISAETSGVLETTGHHRRKLVGQAGEIAQGSPARPILRNQSPALHFFALSQIAL